MDELTDHHFTFVSTSGISQMRLDLGYQDMDHQYPFVIASYESQELGKKAFELADSSDIVILGAAPRKFVLERMKNRKLTFHYSERLFKRGFLGRFSPTTMRYCINKMIGLDNDSQYLMCAGNYVASDFNQIGWFRGRALKWGYFPAFMTYEQSQVIHPERRSYSILWAGRLIDWKHPELILDAAKHLRQKEIPFQITVVGTGELKEELEQQAETEHLNDVITFSGSVSPEKVREYMADSDIFLATSDAQEGWGAVINEAMNSGCAVIASHAMGAAGFLIEHEKNGLVFESGNTADFLEQISCITGNKKRCAELGWNAYQTIANEWNAKTAANRFLKLSESIIHHEAETYKTGPCSPAVGITPKEYLMAVRNR